MATNQAEGMQTLEANLAWLIGSGVVSYEDALEVSVHSKELDRALQRYMQVSADQTAAGHTMPPVGGVNLKYTAETPAVVGRSD
jgi:Tfp pilus assembly ATPase PilU